MSEKVEQIPEVEVVECAGCGRTAEKGDGITAGNDTWFELYAPWALESRIGDNLLSCCSLACLERSIERLREPYEQLEPYLVNDPRHLIES